MRFGLFLAVLLCYLHRGESAVPISSFFPFGLPAGDKLLPSGDDFSQVVPLQIALPFAERRESNIFVSINGVLSFAGGVTTPKPICGPMIASTRMVNPFWADVTTEKGYGGSISYRQTAEQELLRKATQEIVASDPSLLGLNLRWLFIATWYDVSYCAALLCHSNLTAPRNTFQAVLATDGTLSFAIFNYNHISWTSGSFLSGGNCSTGLGGIPAKVGFDAGDGVNFFSVTGSCNDSIVDIDETSNVNLPGKWILRLDNEKANVSCGSSMSISPAFIDSYGHVPVEFRGLCIDPSMYVCCVFHDPSRQSVQVPGEVFYSNGAPVARCIAPYLYSVGVINLDLTAVKSFGQFSTYSGKLNVVWQSASVAVQAVKSTEAIELDVRWNKNSALLNGASQVDTLMLRYDDAAEIWYEMSVTGSKQNNSGHATLSFRPEQLGFPDTVFAKSVVSHAVVSTAQSQSSQSAGWLFANAVCASEYLYSEFDYAEECRDWHSRDQGPPQGLPACPPLLSQAQSDPAFLAEVAYNLQYYNPEAAASFRSSRITSEGAGQQCTYGQDGRLLVGPTGGTADMFSEDFNVPMHVQHDIVPWCFCCKFSNSLETCALYHDKRPSDAGNNYIPPTVSLGNGDPHFITFDNLQYTFNGAGEFWMIKPKETGHSQTDFSMQVRMEAIKQQVDGVSKTASVFTAFVAREASGSVVQVQVSQNSAMQVLVDGYKLSFSEPSLFTQRFGNVLLATESSNAAVVKLTFTSFSFSFSAANGAMSIIAAATDDAAGGKYVGLLGDIDGLASNDLRRPDGLVVDAKANLSEIHNDFGMQWLVSNEKDSMFVYAAGYSYLSYCKPDYQPDFELPDYATLPAQVLELCGQSTACVYDYSITGSLEFANQTVTNERNFDERKAALQQDVVMCSPLSRPHNGYLHATNFFDGAQVSFTCETDYYLTGDTAFSCRNGRWSGSAPICNK